MGRVTVTFLPATIEHARALAPCLRPADLAEVLRHGATSGLDALERSLAASEIAGTAFFGGDVACMYGAVRLDRCSAYVWALTGLAVERDPVAFWRWSKRLVEQMLEHFEALTCDVDADYVAALRWARRLGFEVHPPHTHHATGHLFCVVTLRRN